MTAVLVVDGNERLGRLMGDLLDDDPRFKVVGVVGTLEQARERALATRPDVALVAQQLTGAEGALVCAELRAATPECALLLWSHDTEATKAWGFDVDGILERGMTYDQLARAIRDVVKGGPAAPRIVDLTDAQIGAGAQRY